MENYINLLIKQFIEANNINNPDIKSELFIKEFSNWINERNKVSSDYIPFLLSFNIPLKEEPNTIEIGKGKYDSITNNNKISRITPYLNKKEAPNLLIQGRFIVQAEKPLVLFTQSSHPLDLTSITSLTYITQNPYTKKDIRSWDSLYNNIINNIILGVYGSINDKDIDDKIKMLLDIKDKINTNIIEAYATKNGNYYYALSKKLTK